MRYQKRYALVTNKHNRKQLVVWINDTGGFYKHKGFSGGKRVIDLAKGAATRLGITGLGQVVVQIFPPTFCIPKTLPQAQKLALAHEFLAQSKPVAPKPAHPQQALPMDLKQIVEVNIHVAASSGPFSARDFVITDSDDGTVDTDQVVEPDMISYGVESPGYPGVHSDDDHQRYDIQ